MFTLYIAELSMGWVDPRVGLGWFGSRFFSFSGIGWGASTVPKVLHFRHNRIVLNRPRISSVARQLCIIFLTSLFVLCCDACSVLLFRFLLSDKRSRFSGKNPDDSSY